MKTAIILAMHGMPPNDFPRRELGEFFRLHSAVEGMGGQAGPDIHSQYAVLHQKMRDWPRNPHNDPFKFASDELAAGLKALSGFQVLVGYNEFCSPSLDDVFLQAIREGSGRIVVVTPMMTRGGEHAEKDIPGRIAEVKKLHPDVEIIYAWPFENSQIVHFLNEHIARFTKT
jgi:sirohydrochlorin cobaltochelatase